MRRQVNEVLGTNGVVYSVVLADRGLLELAPSMPDDRVLRKPPRNGVESCREPAKISVRAEIPFRGVEGGPKKQHMRNEERECKGVWRDNLGERARQSG